MLAKNRNISGFTLVELAIVLIIIGLLVGMTLKGKELIESARVKAEVAKVRFVLSIQSKLISAKIIINGL